MSSLVVHPLKGRDMGSNFARECALELIQTMRRVGFGYRLLREPNAQRGSTCAALENANDHFTVFMGFGHGLPGQLFDSRERLMFHQTDAHLLAEKACYVLACFSFRGIGEEAIRHGAVAYVGFTERFIVPQYFRDEMRKCCISGMKEFLLGNCGLTEIEDVTSSEFEATRRTLDELDLGGYGDQAIWSKSSFSYNQNILRFYTRP